MDTDYENKSSPFLLDATALYCEEEPLEEEEVGETEHDQEHSYVLCGEPRPIKSSCFSPLLLLEEDLFWDDGELSSLFAKERDEAQQCFCNGGGEETEEGGDFHLFKARKEAVEWIVKVNRHYGFSDLTAILAANYLDRFRISPYYKKDKCWMIQLVSAACLSLAAKVEETQVPLLLDLQVDAKYIFEAKAIQRMELLLLSTLKWKMHPVTPLSFLDYLIRRLGLVSNDLHLEFINRCEALLLSAISDSRYTSFLPSVLATAAMMHVIDQVDPFNSIDHKNQLLCVLNINKEKVEACYKLILELSRSTKGNEKSHKRKLFEVDHQPIPCSPSVVIDADFSCCDNSNDSWLLGSSHEQEEPEPEPLFKRARTQDQWVFVDIVSTSRR